MRGLKDRRKLTSVGFLVKYTSLLFGGHQGVVPEIHLVTFGSCSVSRLILRDGLCSVGDWKQGSLGLGRHWDESCRTAGGRIKGARAFTKKTKRPSTKGR